MKDKPQSIDGVLDLLSREQHALGLKGLIPLSENNSEAKQALLALFQEMAEEVIGRDVPTPTSTPGIVINRVRAEQRQRLQTLLNKNKENK